MPYALVFLKQQRFGRTEMHTTHTRVHKPMWEHPRIPQRLSAPHTSFRGLLLHTIPAARAVLGAGLSTHVMHQEL